MNKTELIAAVAEQAEMSKKDAEAAVTATIDVISEALRQGEKVQLVGFGSFETKTRAERIGRNPRTGEEVPIPADSDRMYRVFQNLIGNALKYSLPGSRVYLSLEVEGGQAAASVRNTSAAELRPGADYTARFVRGDESRTDGGSGLGLSIVKEIIGCHGEHINVISTEGAGSEFIFSLLLADKDDDED